MVSTEYFAFEVDGISKSMYMKVDTQNLVKLYIVDNLH